MFESFSNWWNRKKYGVVDVTLRGFTRRFGRRSWSMAWDDTTQIDAGRKPTLGVEYFYAELFSANGVSILVDDLTIGFEQFQNAVFERWPEIKEAWVRVYTGSPDVAEHVTLWKRHETY